MVVVMLMAIGFVQVDLLIVLLRRLLTIANELEQILLSLDGNVFLQLDVVGSLASMVAILLEPTVRHPLHTSKGFHLEQPKVVLGDFDNLFLNQEVKDLPASYMLSSASLVSNEFSVKQARWDGSVELADRGRRRPRMPKRRSRGDPLG
jgi:hypothetical protein